MLTELTWLTVEIVLTIDVIETKRRGETDNFLVRLLNAVNTRSLANRQFTKRHYHTMPVHTGIYRHEFWTLFRTILRSYYVA